MAKLKCTAHGRRVFVDAQTGVVHHRTGEASTCALPVQIDGQRFLTLWALRLALASEKR